MNCAVAQMSGVQGLAANFEARLHVSQGAAAATCAHATRHCATSVCDSIATCNLPQGSKEAGFSGDGRRVDCNNTAGMLCSQHASPQRSGGEGILGAASEGGAQLGGHGGGSILAHAAKSSGDAAERADKIAPHEPYQCVKCAKDKQQTQKLLGESGEMYDATRQALEKIQDVHASDELMHFEFWGPFWELTEVRTASFLAFLPSSPSPVSPHQGECECCKCRLLQSLPRG
jgi:hypothetical protein